MPVSFRDGSCSTIIAGCRGVSSDGSRPRLRLGLPTRFNHRGARFEPIRSNRFAKLRFQSSYPRLTSMSAPSTLYDKIWNDHLVDEQPDGTCLIYIDRHLVHEVTSPQAFEGLRLSGRKVRAPEKTLCVVDHNVPTTDRKLPNPDPESAAQRS